MDRVRSGWGLVKALIAVCLLAGVIAMHGLTGSHDAAMALPHHPPAVAQLPAAHPAEVVNAAARSPEVGKPHSHGPAGHTAVPALPSGQPVVEIGPYDDHGHIHSMEDVCLAMLVALLLALVAALALRSLAIAHPAVLAAAPVRVVADGPSPPWHRPTLSKLCVLRT